MIARVPPPELFDKDLGCIKARFSRSASIFGMSSAVRWIIRTQAFALKQLAILNG